MPGVSLRPAELIDMDRMYRWRNQKEIYRWFRDQTEPLDWQDHVAWFTNRPGERYDYIIEYMGSPVGVVAIAVSGDVGIYIGETDQWGQGIATIALNKAVRRHADRGLTAMIHRDNEQSIGLFEKIGFERDGRDNEWLLYVYPNN